MRHFRFSAITITLLVLASNIATAQQPTIVTHILFPTRNYEIALGDTITPVARIINNGPVAINGLKITYLIQNPVTGISPYSNSIVVPSIPPGDSVDETFAPYATDLNIINELGMFNGSLIAQNDTVSSLLFGLRRTSVPFFDPSDNYGKTNPNELTSTSIDVPDQTMWTSVGTTVVDGESATWDPPPPRYPGVGVGPDTMVGPVIRLDRLDYNGNFYSGTGVGDTLTSFPINLQGKTEANLSFDYMRGGQHHYPFGWDADTMFGPESTILNANTGQVVRAGDSLVLEFRDPSQPATNVAPNGWNEIAAIDGGRDFEYKTLYMQIDSGVLITTLNGITRKDTGMPNYLTADFRFRLRLKASGNAPKSSITDDADQWYIDNPRVESPIVPSVEMSWVRVVTPYSKVPITQAVYPIFVDVVTGYLGGWVPQPFTVKIVDPSGDTVYSQSITLAAFGNGADTILQFPNWDATGERGMNGAQFTAIAFVSPNWSEPAELDQTYTKFYLNAETNATGTQEFALDDAGLEPGIEAGNDIPTLTGVRGEGIGFQNTSGSYAMKFQLVKPDTFYGVRAYFASANASPDYIRISLYNGKANSQVPGDTLEQPGLQSTMFAQRGPNWDQFNSYYYPRPILLAAGTYWVSVSQLGVNSMELGGCLARGGMDVVQTDPLFISPKINAIYGPSAPGMPCYGTQWGSGPDDNNGNVSTSYAVEATAGSGGWSPLMPTSGWSPEINYVGIPWSVILQPSLSMANPLIDAGIYVPMIRPIIDPISPASIVNAGQATQMLALEANYPNPFQPSATSTTIEYTLDAQGPTSLTICNVLGNVVKTLVNAEESAGSHVLSWDGRDESGTFVPAGTYLVMLTSSGQRVTSKMIVTE